MIKMTDNMNNYNKRNYSNIEKTLVLARYNSIIIIIKVTA